MKDIKEESSVGGELDKGIQKYDEEREAVRQRRGGRESIKKKKT